MLTEGMRGGRRAVDAAWGLEGTKVGFSATPLEREDLLADTINGTDLKGRLELQIEPNRCLLRYGD